MSCFSRLQTPSPGVKNVTRAACPPLRRAPRNHSTIRLTVIPQRTFNAPLAPAVRGQRPVAPKAAAQDPMAPQQKDERGFVLKEVNILYPHQWCCGATVAQSVNHMAPCAAWQRQPPPSNFNPAAAPIAATAAHLAGWYLRSQCSTSFHAAGPARRYPSALLAKGEGAHAQRLCVVCSHHQAWRELLRVHT
jgi:hypothetical protein